jgi:hypothetical protein
VTTAVTDLLPALAYNSGVNSRRRPATMVSTQFPRAAAAAAAAALIAAGCGSSSKPPSTGGGSGAPQNFVQAAYKFARCMRAHGVSNFPDPHVSTSNGSTQIAIRVVGPKGSPAFKTAQTACQGILPGPQSETPAQRHLHEQVLLAFARCLRSHGLTSFPDPNAQGQLTREMIAAAGIDLHQPAVLTAARSCVGVTHGVITMAMVEQAINR